MAELRAYSCDAVTGEPIDRVTVSSYTYDRMMSAGADGTVSIPLDGTFAPEELANLLMELSRVLVFERDGVVEFIGQIVGQSRFVHGSGVVQVSLKDLWFQLGRRGAWDHNAPNVEVWQTTVNGSLAAQAAAAINRGRTGPALPRMGLPVTVPSFGGASVSRTYYGYHVEMVGDVLADLLDEGLDIYFQPRWFDGKANWLMRAGSSWGSGVVHEFYVGAEKSDVVEFGSASDALLVTNNARYIGEGSEVDMLVRSNRNTASPYPLLDRATNAKNISNALQLTALANQDLATYAGPTSQWDFKVLASHLIDVGDTARIHVSGHPLIVDGFYDRRVVRVSGDQSDVKTIGVQPVGGA